MQFLEQILRKGYQFNELKKAFVYNSSRHTTATLAITAGADISSVKEVLGHSSVVSTEVYAMVNLEKKIQAVNLVDGVFG